MATRYLTYNEAAERLCVSVRTVRRYAAEGRLAVRRVSHKTVLVPFPFQTPKKTPFRRPEPEAEK